MADASVHAPSADTLLAVWEKGVRQPAAYRALLLLAATEADTTLESLADLPLGERNRRLVDPDPSAPAALAQRRRAFAEEIRATLKRVDAIGVLAASRRAGLLD